MLDNTNLRCIGFSGGITDGGILGKHVAVEEWLCRDREMSKVWLITGAGRGMGVDIAKAALALGHKVVATGRNIDRVAQAVGRCGNLFVVKLDITKPTDA